MASGTSAGSAAASGAAAGSVFGPWGALIGGGVGLLGSLFSKQSAAPTIPFTPTSLADSQSQALAANTASEPGLEALLAKSNSFQQSQATSLMEQAIPGFGKLQQNLLSTTNDLLKNPYGVPTDVTQNIQRLAAERGISGGTRGGFNDFSLLRDFGVNSLQAGQQRIGQAQSLAQTIAGLAPKVNPMSPLSFYVTPQQQASVTQSNNAGALGQTQGGANANTAASNYNSTNMWDNILQGLLYGSQIKGTT